MARPKKIGLGYFPLDCQMDDKVEMLEAEHGLEGFAVYIKLLQSIYQTDAGELDMSVIFRWKTLAKSWGLPVERLRGFVDTMLEVALFDKPVFLEREVLTSSGIQKRISTVSGLRDKDRVRKTTETGGFPYGKQVENIRKSTQKEKEKEKETTDVVTSAPEPLKANPAKQTAVALTDPDDEQHWSAGPLTKPRPFQVICERLGFLEIDFEHYRKQGLVSAEDADISRTINQWSSWIRNYLNNQMKAGPLLKAAAVDLTRATPRHELPTLGADCTGRHIVLPNTGDANMNRMFAANYTRDYPGATIHQVR